ncbi:L,D-transpeptidase [Candidatus Uhrbacteria bacterium]|nr:L,D-transpeptidase [Candidatus Uhrbacteria bacterium]
MLCSACSAYADSVPFQAIHGYTVRGVDTIAQQDLRRIPLADYNLSYGKDSDGDGLSDHIEAAVGIHPSKIDSDADGYADKTELLNGFDPRVGSGAHLPYDETFASMLSESILLEQTPFGAVAWYVHPNDRKLYFLWQYKNLKETLKHFRLTYTPIVDDTATKKKRIEVNLATQRLSYFIDSFKLGEMVTSTGKNSTPTPIGTFRIMNKAARAWSKTAGLWLPKWMAFAYGGKYGLHELPEWPGGRKEGANHLGRRVSGGCIRLGVADAAFLYDWTPVGAEVVVKK